MNTKHILGLSALVLSVAMATAQADDRGRSGVAEHGHFESVDLAAKAIDGNTPLTVEVEAPGGPVQLIHQGGQGWHVTRKGGTTLAANGSPTSDVVETNVSGEPQAVFIDGPSGIVFGFFVDRGWQVVGHLGSGKR